jgi:hypothetical protein
MTGILDANGGVIVLGVFIPAVLIFFAARAIYMGWQDRERR